MLSLAVAWSDIPGGLVSCDFIFIMRVYMTERVEVSMFRFLPLMSRYARKYKCFV